MNRSIAVGYSLRCSHRDVDAKINFSKVGIVIVEANFHSMPSSPPPRPLISMNVPESSCCERKVGLVEFYNVTEGRYVCANGGNCTSPGVCECTSAWSGFDCRTPVCSQVLVELEVTSNVAGEYKRHAHEVICRGVHEGRGSFGVTCDGLRATIRCPTKLSHRGASGRSRAGRIISLILLFSRSHLRMIYTARSATTSINTPFDQSWA